jgi:hypothetical protein
MSESPDGSNHPDSAFRAGIQRLYAGSRPQFHHALYVLLYAGMYALLMSVGFWVFNRLFGWNLAVDFEIFGIFLAMLATAELVKGHWKSWAGKAAADWCFPAIAAGGASLGFVFSALQALRWGISDWVEYAIYIVGGTAFYLLLGWLFWLQEREKQR